MSELNRREFVVVLGGCACAAACLGTNALAQEAPAEGTTDEKETIEVGAIGDYADEGIKDTWAKSDRFFVVRKGNRIFAPAARCTHKACALKLKDKSIACSCHGSTFSDEGAVNKGPAKIPLPRFGISQDAQGKLIVDKTKKFDESKWNEAGAFVELPAS